MNKLLKILLSNYFIALVVAVLVYLLFPPGINFYQAELIHSSLRKNNYLVLVDNLDNEKEKEQIELSAYSTGPVIKVRNFDTKGIKKVIPLHGDWLYSKSAIIANYDHNNNKELYTTLIRNDSIFLLQVSFTDKRLNDRKKLLFLNRMHYFNGKEDLMTLVNDTLDYNHDGFEDIIITYTAGYTLSPRKIVIADIKNQRTITSMDIGVKVPIINETFDLNGDGNKEIFTTSQGTSNHDADANTPYADTNSWLMVFTDSLNFYIPPVAYPSPASSVWAIPFVKDDSVPCILSLSYNNSNKPIGPGLVLYNNAGKEIWEIPLSNSQTPRHGLLNIFSLPEKGFKEALVLDYIRNRILLIKSNLNIIIRKMPAEFQYPVRLTVNSSGRGKDYILYDVESETMCLTDENIRHMQVFNPANMKITRNGKSVSAVVKKKNRFLLQGKKNIYTLDYRRNPLYPYRIIFILLYYLLALLLVYLIQRPVLYQWEKRRQMQTEIINYQLNASIKLFSPHFSLNALNSVYSALISNHHEKASKYILHFSRLFRKALANSDKIAIPLSEEIENVRDFLSLEQMRLNYAFDFDIHIDEATDKQVPVPRLCVFNEAENAVKHGISRLKERPGNIKIEIKLIQDILQLSVADNGIGREQALAYNTESTKKGREITERIYTLFNKLYGVKVNRHIYDLYEENGQTAGTRSIITALYHRLLNIKY